MSDWTVRVAAAQDAAGLLAIYAPVVLETAISFEVTVPSVEQFAARIEGYNATHRWLAAEHRGELAGYACGTPHREREAYRYSTEVSVYVHAAWRGRGIGADLYQRLFDELAALGYCHAYAGITVPNAASMALHAGAGFRHVGTLPNVGFKFGAWHDVSWWHRPLRSGLPDDGGSTS